MVNDEYLASAATLAAMASASERERARLLPSPAVIAVRLAAATGSSLAHAP